MANVKKRGNSYRIRVSCGYDVKGSQRYENMTWRIPEGMSEIKAEKEANRQAVLFEEKCKNGFSTTSVKFEIFLDQWFNEIAKIKYKERSLDTYEGLSKRVRKEIGHLRLDKITTRDIQRMISALIDGKRNDGKDGKISAKTVKQHVTLTSSVFEYAIKTQLVSYNPCKNATLPEHEKKERDIYSLDEASKFISLLSKETGHKFDLAVFLILAVYTGFRRGELLGLEWNDFSDGFSVVTVQRAACYSKKLGYFTSTPKTKKSLRTLKLPKEIAS